MKTYKTLEDTLFFKKDKEIKESDLKSFLTELSIDLFIKSKFIEEVKELPKTWKELEEVDGYFVGINSSVSGKIISSTDNENRNIFPTKEEAEASIALAQLCQLRDGYNEGWKPDWTDDTYKYVVEFHREEACTTVYLAINRPLAFKTEELTKEFLNNFSDLIEKAKPLL